jgi:hypothetical protein
MEPPKPSGPDYLPPAEVEMTADQLTDWMAQNMPDKPEYLSCFCEKCSQKLEFPVELFAKNFNCPTCGELTWLFNREYGDLVMAELHRRVQAYCGQVDDYVRRLHACPNCGSLDYDVYEPPRPIVFGPMTFVGQLLAGVSNSMADSMFRPERVCCKCGHRRPHF